jgi:hypothetical protein
MFQTARAEATSKAILNELPHLGRQLVIETPATEDRRAAREGRFAAWTKGRH